MSISLWGLTFFGLTQEYRISLFTQIHEICFHGNGGYDFDTIYNSPIWLRLFIYKSIKDYYKNQQETLEKTSKKKQTSIPSFNPKKVSYK
jgi:hypothetical protein